MSAARLLITFTSHTGEICGHLVMNDPEDIPPSTFASLLHRMVRLGFHIKTQVVRDAKDGLADLVTRTEAKAKELGVPAMNGVGSIQLWESGEKPS